MNSAIFYEKFFQSNEWIEYKLRQGKKQEILTNGEAHILTPKATLLTKNQTYVKYLLRKQPVKLWLSLCPSEIEIIFDAIEEFRGANAGYRTMEIYVHSVKLDPKTEFYHFRKTEEEDILEETIATVAAEVARLMYRDKKQLFGIGLCEDPKQLFGIEIYKAWIFNNIPSRCLETMRRKFHGYLSRKLYWDICELEKEYFGCISRDPHSGDYFLDAAFLGSVKLGDKHVATEKIKKYIELECSELSSKELMEGISAKLLYYLKNLEKNIADAKTLFEERIKAESNSINLMADMLGKGIVDKLFRNGYITVENSQGESYKIDAHGEVYSLPEEDFVCLEINADEDVPKFDEILAKYLCLKSSLIDEMNEHVYEQDALLDEEPFWSSEAHSNKDEEERKARKNATYDVNMDGRIIALSLEEQGERVN